MYDGYVRIPGWRSIAEAVARILDCSTATVSGLWCAGLGVLSWLFRRVLKDPGSEYLELHTGGPHWHEGRTYDRYSHQLHALSRTILCSALAEAVGSLGDQGWTFPALNRGAQKPEGFAGKARNGRKSYFRSLDPHVASGSYQAGLGFTCAANTHIEKANIDLVEGLFTTDKLSALSDPGKGTPTARRVLVAKFTGNAWRVATTLAG